MEAFGIRSLNGRLLPEREALGELLMPMWHALKIEVLRALFMDRAGKIVSDEVIATGMRDTVPFPMRLLLFRALSLDAWGCVLTHNHPSGDPTPSYGDRELTAVFRTVVRKVNIHFRGHYIIGRDRFGVI